MRKSVIAIIVALAVMIPAGCDLGGSGDKTGGDSGNTAYTTESGQDDVAGLTEKSENSETTEDSEKETAKEPGNTEGQSEPPGEKDAVGQNKAEGREGKAEEEQTTDAEIPDGLKLNAETDGASEAILKDASELHFTDTDGGGCNYSFTYAGEEFRAVYTTENWKIYDSYRINSEPDLLIICQVLIDEHPIHGRDMVSYRTAEDMVYEWQIHNLAYAFLGDDDPLKDDTRDVDLDPKDQGLSVEEFYKSRTGKDLDIDSILGFAPDD